MTIYQRQQINNQLQQQRNFYIYLFVKFFVNKYFFLQQKIIQFSLYLAEHPGHVRNKQTNKHKTELEMSKSRV